ncbi:MAG TPA: hypothetical protein VIJ16_03600, partial [Gemmatimonadaceae bacterium]
MALSCTSAAVAIAQRTASANAGPPPVTFTAEQDHQNMMAQLGITALRPGPSGTETAPNHANVDEALATPYATLPDAFTMNNGEKVTTAEMWWKQRRPEIAREMEQNVYGRLPDHIPSVQWITAVTDTEFVGRTRVVAKQLVGHVDNSAYPFINVDIKMVVVVPLRASGPVPVLMMFGRAALPAPAPPPPDQLAQVNAALRALLAEKDTAVRAILERYPAYEPIAPPAGGGFGGRGFGPPAGAPGAAPTDPP